VQRWVAPCNAALRFQARREKEKRMASKEVKRLRELRTLDALQTIHRLMDGKEWTPETFEQIADVLRDAGYRVRQPEEVQS